MATDLILVRHGNTFGPGDKVVWCGARTDLPLTETGVAQAEELAETLAKADINVSRILAGPLMRTRQHAEILARIVSPNQAPEIIEPLREIDYGAWEGLSTEEIHALGGGQELAAWDTEARWPERPGWSPSEQQILSRIQAVLADVSSVTEPNPVVIVTSNGILRFFARCAINPPAISDLKVRTGHHCHMRIEGDAWKVLKWNLGPAQDPF